MLTCARLHSRERAFIFMSVPIAGPRTGLCNCVSLTRKEYRMAEEEQNKGRLATAVLAGSALAFSSFAFGAPAAFADTEDDPSTPASSTDEAQLEVDSSTLTPGDILVLSGTGFAPEGDIDVTVHPDDSAVNAEQTQADDDGNFEVEVEIPDDIENGEYSITADGPENT